MKEETKEKIKWIIIFVVMTIVLILGLFFYPHISDCPSGMCNWTGV